MSTICPNGHEVRDNVGFCPKCGAEIKESGIKFCPKCGKERKGVAQFCPNCGNPYEGAPAPNIQTTNTTSDLNTFFNKNKIVIPILVGIILLCLIGGGWWYWKSNASKNQVQPTAKSSYRYSPSSDTKQIQKEVDDESDLWISVWGNMGESAGAVLQFEKGSGWYAMSQDAPEDSRRILSVKSYDKRSGHLVFNAYYKGDYIGVLDGKFMSDRVDFDNGDYNVIQSYSGTFKSVKGVDIEFSFHGD